MKNSIVSMFAIVKFITVLIILGGTFYLGIYTQTSNKSGPLMVAEMKSAIVQAMTDTSEQPVIVIVPNYSLYELAKSKVGFGLPEREIITISTSVATKRLGIELPEEPGVVKAGFKVMGDTAKSGWSSVKNGWGYLCKAATPADTAK